MKIAICDDENYYLSYMKELVEKCCSGIRKMEFDVFESGEEFLEAFERGKYDIVILDVELKQMNGLEVAEKIRNSDLGVILVFLTSHEEFATFGYEVNAFRYILKGQPEELYLRQITSILNEYKQKNMMFSIQEKNEIYNIPVSDIRYFEIFNRKIVVHTTKRTYEFHGKITEIENDDRLIDFVKPHRSYYVNLAYIDHIEKETLILNDDEKVLLSRKCRPAVTEQFLSYMTVRC